MADNYAPAKLGPTLETKRLILRPPQAEDFAAYAHLYTDQEVVRYLGGIRDEAQAWRAFASVTGSWVLRGFGFFFLFEKASGQFVGSIGTQFPHGWPGREVGWVIARKHWRKGYGKEAVQAVLTYAFETLESEEVIHIIHPDNLPSQALAASIGSRHLRTIHHLPGFGDVTNQVWGQVRAKTFK